MRLLLISFSLLFLSIPQIFAQKKALTIADFDQWKRLDNVQLSSNGQYVAYRLKGEIGDATYILHSLKDNRIDSFFQVKEFSFGHFQKRAFLRTTLSYEAVRDLKRKKEKKENYPADSLFVIDLSTGKKKFIDLIKSWKSPKRNDQWLAYLKEESPVVETPEELTDSTATESEEIKEKEEEAEKEVEKEKKEEEKPSKKKDEKPKDKDARTLILLNFKTQALTNFDQVKEYLFSPDGHYLVFATLGDSLTEPGLYRYDTRTDTKTEIHQKATKYSQLSIDTLSSQLVFLHYLEADKSENKNHTLVHYSFDKQKIHSLDSQSFELRQGINPDVKPSFTEDGLRLTFGIKTKAKEYPKDSLLLDEEKPMLDIWNHNDGRIQPQQLKELKRDQKKGLFFVLNLKTLKHRKITRSVSESTRISENSEGDYALIYNASPYHKERSWESPWAQDVYLHNLKTDKREVLFTHFLGRVNFSPQGKYLYWFDQKEGYWWLMDLKSKKRTNLTENNKNAYLNLDDDHPMLPNSFGTGGWYEDDAFLFLYTKRGITAFDPTGKIKPITIQDDNRLIRQRLIRITSDRFISSEHGCFLQGFHRLTKEKDLQKMTYSPREKKFNFEQKQAGNSSEPFYTYYSRSENHKTVLYRLEKSGDYPELYYKKGNAYIQLSNTNPQQKKYKWYETELISYLTADGDSLQGILYKPENFDPTKKYPMVVYFYEKMSDHVNSYQTPRPSYSTISRSFYCSNDYFVFVPDIIYTDGEPGQSAFNCIVPGVLNVLQNRPYIDASKLALQGQSWGGYQTAHLITRSDLFACAMAGAPVSNMTSAYGGIRWGSGYNRAFQYEHGQSRIGGSLWEKPLEYLENSPVFYANRVNTPLLIMHNDQDGAVPWYQGIEYFMALRRLEKPTWLMVYNKEQHNLTKRPNRVDLSHRMFGFFNYYLKGMPQPAWMEEGIPAIDKGKYPGY